MILENGVVRTMDPSLPTAAALADRRPAVAGGVGVHETALPTPDRVDLRGLCVLPAFTDSHVHFPTWSLAQRDVRLEGTASLGRGTRSHRGVTTVSAPGSAAPAGVTPTGPSGPRRQALDGPTGTAPAALWAKDYHSLWLNTAGTRRSPPATSRSPAASSSATRRVSRRASSARSPRGASASASSPSPTTSGSAATRQGIRIANSRGVAAIHDKDGRLGAAVRLRPHPRARGADPTRLAVAPGREAQ